MKIGWFSNWLSFDYLRDSGVPKNIREVAILRELLKHNQIVWLGTNANADGVNVKGVLNYGGFLKGVPRYDKSVWSSTANYVRGVTVNFHKYTRYRFPRVDAVFVRVLPSFIYENLKIYIMLYHYGILGVPVFVRDLELLMIKRFVENRATDGKPFAVSGSDKAFSQDEWDIMSRNVIMINPIPREGNIFLKEKAPHLSFETFYFPYDPNIYPCIKPAVPSYKVAYVGNDTGRRAGFSKYLSGLPAHFMHVFGGAARQVGGGSKLDFPELFRKKFPNITFHGVISHSKVNSVYNSSAICMNLPKPIFSKVGFVSARFMEAVFSGAVLCLPSEFKNALHWTRYHSLVIKNSNHIKEVANYLAEDYEARLEVLEEQREVLKEESCPQKNVERLLGYVK